MIADLLVASGRECIEEVRESYKKVDIICEWEDPLEGAKRILIEAKAYKKTLRMADIQSFITDYSALVAKTSATGAWLVSKGEISPDARKHLETIDGLRCFTYEELQRRLINLNRYMRDQIAFFESSGIGRYFHPTISEEGERLETVIRRWLMSDDHASLAILSDYGTGKTTFARYLTATLAAEALEDLSQRVPIYIPLGEINDDQSLDGLLGKIFTSRNKPSGYHFQLFEELNALGRFVLILDGFDEMKHGMTFSRFSKNINELLRMEKGRAKILFLGRPTVFHSQDEFLNIVHGERLNSAGLTLGQLHRKPMQVATIQELDVEHARLTAEKFFRFRCSQIRSTDAKRGRSWQDRRLRELQSRSLNHLIVRPVHLQMLCEVALIPDLDLRNMSKHRLFESFLYHLLDREVRKDGRFPAFGVAVRRSFNCELASWLWQRSGAPNISLKDIPDQICQRAAQHIGHEFDQEGLRRELVAGCFADYGGEVVYFRHRSLQEFLVAEYIIDGTPDDHDKSLGNLLLAKVNVEIGDFVLDRLAAEEWPYRTVSRLMDQVWRAEPVALVRDGLRLIHEIVHRSQTFIRPKKKKDQFGRTSDATSENWKYPSLLDSRWKVLFAHVQLAQSGFVCINDENVAAHIGILNEALGYGPDVQAASLVYWATACAIPTASESTVHSLLSCVFGRRAFEATIKNALSNDCIVNIENAEEFALGVLRQALVVEAPGEEEEIHINFSDVIRTSMARLELEELGLAHEAKLRYIWRGRVSDFLQFLEPRVDHNLFAAVRQFLSERQLRLRIRGAI